MKIIMKTGQQGLLHIGSHSFWTIFRVLSVSLGVRSPLRAMEASCIEMPIELQANNIEQ